MEMLLISLHFPLFTIPVHGGIGLHLNMMKIYSVIMWVLIKQEQIMTIMKLMAKS